MKIFFKLSQEAFRFAVDSLWVHKLRTLLSLLGITIGIFAVIAVLTLVDSMEYRIKESFSSLGSEVLYLERFPWEFGDDYPWWKYVSRPQPKISEYLLLKERCQLAEAVCMRAETGGKEIEYGSKSLSIAVEAVSQEFNMIRDLEFSDGRYFSTMESQRGTPVVILGALVAEKLFENESPIGKYIKMLGQRMRVIGVFSPQGTSAAFSGLDNRAVMPFNNFRTVVDIRRGTEPKILIKSKPGIALEELKSELTGIMRGVRKLQPAEDDNFAINQSSLITNQVGAIFGGIALIGSLIGGFSILVGGFGIANIMFVSVRERTNIIGINKALGAKKSFILFQFIIEAVVLCLIGGALGIILVLLLVPIVNAIAADSTGFDIFLSFKNAILGLGISAAIGLISGMIPASMAARMDPVKAIRFTA